MEIIFLSGAEWLHGTVTICKQFFCLAQTGFGILSYNRYMKPWLSLPDLLTYTTTFPLFLGRPAA